MVSNLGANYGAELRMAMCAWILEILGCQEHNPLRTAALIQLWHGWINMNQNQTQKMHIMIILGWC